MITRFFTRQEQRPSLWWVLLALFGIVTALLYIQPLWAIADRVPLNYNEGWNAYHAQAAITGGLLYPPAAAFVTNNYPPISFYVVGALGVVVGDNIIAGRLIALASLLVVAVNVALAARSLGATRPASWFAALLLLGYAGGYFANYVAMNDPQWLAHALMTSGLVIFVRRRALPAFAALMAPVLIVVGLFTKQNAVVLPLAIVIWCGIYDRAELKRWLIAGAATTAFLLGVCYLWFGPDFVSGLLAPRPYSMSRLVAASRKYASPLLFLGAAGIWLLVLERRHPNIRLLLAWAGLGIAAGVASFGGAGVNYNALFDPTIALCIAAGVLLSRLAGANPRAALAALLLTALPALTPVPRRVGQLFAFIRHRPAALAEAQSDLAFLARVDGRVACEMSALCYWAGKEFEIDFFNTEQKILLGVVNPDLLAKMFDDRAYAAVVLTTHAPTAEEPPQSVMAQLYANYRAARISANGWTIWFPDNR